MYESSVSEGLERNYGGFSTLLNGCLCTHLSDLDSLLFGERRRVKRFGAIIFSEFDQKFSYPGS